MRLRDLLLREAQQSSNIPVRVWSHCAAQVLEWVSSQIQKQLSQRSSGRPASANTPAQPSLWAIFADLQIGAQQYGRPLIIPDVIPYLITHCQLAGQLVSETETFDAVYLVPVLVHLLQQRSEHLLSSLERR